MSAEGLTENDLPDNAGHAGDGERDRSVARRNLALVFSVVIAAASAAGLYLWTNTDRTETGPAGESFIQSLVSPPEEPRVGDQPNNPEAVREALAAEERRWQAARTEERTFVSAFGAMSRIAENPVEEVPPSPAPAVIERYTEEEPPEPDEAMLALMQRISAPAAVGEVGWYGLSGEPPESEAAPGNTDAPSADGEGVPIAPFTVAGAVVETAVNSWQPGTPVVVRLTDTLPGAQLQGKFTERNGMLIVEFSRMKAPDGRLYEIDAVAVDPETRQQAVRSDIDHHWLSRFGLFAAGTFASAYAEALSTGERMVTISPFGGVAAELPQIEDAGLYAGGVTVGEIAGLARNHALNTESEVTLDRGEFIGVLFLDEEAG